MYGMPTCDHMLKFKVHWLVLSTPSLACHMPCGVYTITCTRPADAAHLRARFVLPWLPPAEFLCLPAWLASAPAAASLLPAESSDSLMPDRM
jgi:hypothetical protein